MTLHDIDRATTVTGHQLLSPMNTLIPFLIAEYNICTPTLALTILKLFSPK
jgi:hypothetical protein